MNTNGRNILVVEDDALIRFALVDYLIDEGFHVLEAGDALTAIAVFGKADRIDAIISDIDMPGLLNGIDFVNLVARSNDTTAIVVTSGRNPEHCLGLPVGALYLQKPYDERRIAEYLLARVQQDDDFQVRKIGA
jgi:DNA-binding response OmpR family regulator